MTKKTIKAVSLLAAISLVLTCFGGCKKDVKSPSAGVGAEVKLNGDKIYPIECEDTLTYWLWTGAWTAEYENFGDTPLGKKIYENTGVKVEYMHPTQGQGDEQIQLLIASDELPDMVQHGWNNYPGGPDVAVNDSYILKLNDLIDAYSPAFKAALASNEDWDKQSKTDSGTYYAYSMLAQPGELQVSYGPAIRKDLLEKTGLSVPRTLDQWEEVLQALKKNGVNYPFIGSSKVAVKAFAPAFGTYPGWYQNGGEVLFGQMQPEYKDLLIKLNDWYNQGLIDPDIANIDGKVRNSRLFAGESAATLAWNGSDIGSWLAAHEGENGFDIITTQFPAMKDGENAEYSEMGSTVSIQCGIALSTNCKNPELAARFLDYGYTQEGHNLFNFGIEGESYNWIDRGGEPFPKMTDLIVNNPDGLTVAQLLYTFIHKRHNGARRKNARRFLFTPAAERRYKRMGEVKHELTSSPPALYGNRRG